MTYKWRSDNSDRRPAAHHMSEDLTLTNVNGITHTQQWLLSQSRNCQTCHNANAGYFLGPKTAQLNGTFTYPTGISDNQIRTWRDRHVQQSARTDEYRCAAQARGMMDTTAADGHARAFLPRRNCSQCHRPVACRPIGTGASRPAAPSKYC